MIYLMAIALLIPPTQTSLPSATGSWDGPFRLEAPMRLDNPLRLGSEIKVTLTWTQLELQNVRAWIIYDGDTALVEVSGEPTVTLRHVSPGKHAYRVTACNEAGESESSNTFFLDTLAVDNKSDLAEFLSFLHIESHAGIPDTLVCISSGDKDPVVVNLIEGAANMETDDCVTEYNRCGVCAQWKPGCKFYPGKVDWTPACPLFERRQPESEEPSNERR